MCVQKWSAGERVAGRMTLQTDDVVQLEVSTGAAAGLGVLHSRVGIPIGLGGHCLAALRVHDAQHRVQHRGPQVQVERQQRVRR